MLIFLYLLNHLRVFNLFKILHAFSQRGCEAFIVLWCLFTHSLSILALVIPLRLDLFYVFSMLLILLLFSSLLFLSSWTCQVFVETTNTVVILLLIRLKAKAVDDWNGIRNLGNTATACLASYVWKLSFSRRHKIIVQILISFNLPKQIQTNI